MVTLSDGHHRLYAETDPLNNVFTSPLSQMMRAFEACTPIKQILTAAGLRSGRVEVEASIRDYVLPTLKCRPTRARAHRAPRLSPWYKRRSGGHLCTGFLQRKSPSRSIQVEALVFIAYLD
jgi:hypothetical protein